jgi:hypothetical protein
LSARGLIPQIHHHKWKRCPGSREKAGCFFHPSSKDQNGSLRILRSRRILLYLDTWTFKPGQTTLWGQNRLWKGPSKLQTRQKKAFQEIKRLLTSTPALGLQDITWPFNLLVCEKNHTALWVLTQTVGT